MGTIVKLPSPPKRRRAAMRSTDEATILFFMGVRYVRDTEADADPARPIAVAPRHQDEAPLEIA